jgi:hypothetical protein
MEAMLMSMSEAGQLFMIQLGQGRYYKMLPWIFGIYEFQLGRLDKELAGLLVRYGHKR